MKFSLGIQEFFGAFSFCRGATLSDCIVILATYCVIVCLQCNSLRFSPRLFVVLCTMVHEIIVLNHLQGINSCNCTCLRGPAAILFILRDACSDSIAKLFRACFYGVSHNYRAICCKMGYRTDVPMWNEVPRGGIAPFWGNANLPEKVSRDMGYRSDSIAVSRDMGPLRYNLATKSFCNQLLM